MGSVPPYERIAEELRAAISRGDLAHGAQLPSERTLAAQHGVARNTARQAIATLQAEGLVTAEHGRGVFVRERAPFIRLGHDRYGRARRLGRSPFYAEVERTGGRPHVTTPAVERVAAPGWVAEALGIAEGTTVVRRENRFFIDDRPVQLVDTFIPVAIAKGTLLEQRDPGPGGIYVRLEELGYRLVSYDEQVLAYMPPRDAARTLALPPGVPVLEVRHVSRDQRQRVFEATRFVLAADRNALSYRIVLEDQERA